MVSSPFPGSRRRDPMSLVGSVSCNAWVVVGGAKADPTKKERGNLSSNCAKATKLSTNQSKLGLEFTSLGLLYNWRKTFNNRAGCGPCCSLQPPSGAASLPGVRRTT